MDAGPLVALLDRHEKNHEWAKEQVRRLPPGFLTCESVISEACFLLRRTPGAIPQLLEYLEKEFILVPFHLDEELTRITQLLARYEDAPMSVADACLVRMAELYQRSVVFTLDHHFTVYRKNGRQIIPTLMPPIE